MSRHPIRLLVPAFICVVVFGFCVALLARAIYTNADSFVLVGGVGALFFGCRTVTEARQVWRQFVAQLQQRRSMRRAAPLTRINLPKEDIQ